MAFDRFPGFGFGGERRPPPRRITPPGPHDHEDFVIKQQLKAGKLFQQDSCALCLFFEETNTAAFTCDKDGGGRKFYCAKHVKKIPEHNRGHKNYHAPMTIYPHPTMKRKEFDDILDKNIDDTELLADCMIEELNIHKAAMIKSVHDRAKAMREHWARAMLIQEGVVKSSFERNSEERRNRVIAEQQRFDHTKKPLEDFRSGKMTDEEEFKRAAFRTIELMQKCKCVVPLTPYIGIAPGGKYYDAFGPTPMLFSWTKVDAINCHWRDLSAAKLVYVEPNEMPKWNLRDFPVITVEHPDRAKLGVAMIAAISLRARVLIECGFIRPYESMDQIRDLVEKSAANRKTLAVIYRNDTDDSLHRMALRYLSPTFKDTRETLALQIFFDLIDEEMNVKDVVSLIRDEFRAPGLEYQLRKNYRGITLNTFIIFPQDEIELKFIKKALNDDPYLFKRDGVAKIEAKSKSNYILTDLDDPSNPPVVITEQRLKDKNILECPDDLQVSMAMPAMVIECWFDMAHPTGGEKNYDPIMKQLLIMSTLHEIRLEVNQMRKPLKISLEKPCEYERMPWVWICAAKVKGKSIEDEMDAMWVKRTYGFAAIDEERGDCLDNCQYDSYSYSDYSD